MGNLIISLSAPAAITEGGATFSLTNVTGQGEFWDGTPWVTVASGAEITSVTPASATISRAYETSQADPTLITTTAASHGLEFAPGRGDGDGLSTQQGFDALDLGFANAVYDGTRNIDPGATGSAVSVQSGVYVKAISKTTGIRYDARPVLSELVPLSVITTAPGADEFRPPYAGDGSPVGFGPADLDLSHLQNHASSGFTGDFPTYAEAVQLLSGFSSTEQRTYNVLTRNIMTNTGDIIDGLQNSVYTGFWYETVANIMLALNFDFYTTAEKRELAARIVQEAVDIAERANQGGVWQENGGHSHGRKEVVAFAARLTGEARFTNALALTTTVAVFGGGNASIWGSDRQIFTIQQADIDREKTYPYTQSQLGWPEWSGDATRDDPSPIEGDRQNSLGVDTTIAGNSYRYIVAKASVPFALALRMMNAKDIRGNQVWFDYQDRHAAARIANGGPLPISSTNDVHPFALWAWEQHRAALGGVWSSS